jgi:hypothetical protein
VKIKLKESIRANGVQYLPPAVVDTDEIGITQADADVLIRRGTAVAVAVAEPAAPAAPEAPAEPAEQPAETEAAATEDAAPAEPEAAPAKPAAKKK